MKYPELLTSTEIINKARAEELLAARVLQRPIVRAAVEFIKQQIRDGLWTLHHQGFAISNNGHFMDGQHRAQAIVELDVALPVRVTYGMDEAAFTTMDVGRKRHSRDVLGTVGFSNLGIFAPAAKLALQLCRENVQFNIPVSNEEILRFVNANKDALEYYVYMVSKHRFARPQLAAVAFTFSTVVKSSEKVDKFLEDVHTGNNLSANNPAFRLREKLQTCRMKGVRLQVETLLAWTMLAANKYFLGKTLTQFSLAEEAHRRYLVATELGKVKVAGI